MWNYEKRLQYPVSITGGVKKTSCFTVLAEFFFFTKTVRHKPA